MYVVVNFFAKYNKYLVHEKMMAHGMLPPNEAEKPRKNGLVTFAGFFVFGSAPLLSFVVLIPAFMPAYLYQQPPQARG
ncbi:hypothetical protein DVH24_026115 [Malus domestica]|uniref:Uncharacterized protein n=1 Tax=Malus domestica TaxID=3750 RepID=A0A498KFN4_MALDO|nr:hypothetical protein DVH24_026115 [Malus domestica]